LRGSNLPAALAFRADRHRFLFALKGKM